MDSHSLVIGLVAEGVTDLDFLQLSIEQTLRDHGFEGALSFRHIQPELDATSGKHGDGSWSRVHQWCIAHPPDARRLSIFQPLFAGRAPLDALVVHLDGDVLDEYKPHVKVALPKKPWTPAKRADFVEAALNEWLWPGAQERDENHILAVMVRALESWLLAAYDRNLLAPEDMDPEPALRTASPHLNPPQTPGARLRKKPNKWEKMSQDALPHLAHIRNVCPSSERFFSQVEALPLEK